MREAVEAQWQHRIICSTSICWPCDWESVTLQLLLQSGYTQTHFLAHACVFTVSSSSLLFGRVLKDHKTRQRNEKTHWKECGRQQEKQQPLILSPLCFLSSFVVSVFLRSVRNIFVIKKDWWLIILLNWSPFLRKKPFKYKPNLWLELNTRTEQSHNVTMPLKGIKVYNTICCLIPTDPVSRSLPVTLVQLLCICVFSCAIMAKCGHRKTAGGSTSEWSNVHLFLYVSDFGQALLKQRSMQDTLLCSLL